MVRCHADLGMDPPGTGKVSTAQAKLFKRLSSSSAPAIKETFCRRVAHFWLRFTTVGGAEGHVSAAASWSTG